jgi:hypothetical protein
MADVRKGSRDGIATVFAPELGGLARDARRRRVGALDAALSGESWDLLRGTHGMSFTEAYETMVWTAGVLLAGEGR